MLKPIIKNFNVKEQECGFDFRSSYAQVCELQGKRREEEVRKMVHTQQAKNLIVTKNVDVQSIMEDLNSATPIISERDYEVKRGDEVTPMHSHTTIYRSPEVVVNVDSELTLRLSKRSTRVKITNKKTNEVKISGETHYKLYVNDVLYKIDAPTVPDSTIQKDDEGFTVNFHGEQQFVAMLEKQLRF